MRYIFVDEEKMVLHYRRWISGVERLSLNALRDKEEKRFGCGCYSFERNQIDGNTLAVYRSSVAVFQVDDDTDSVTEIEWSDFFDQMLGKTEVTL